MKRTITDTFCILVILVIMFWASMTWSAEPRVELTVTAIKAGNITVIDARGSTGTLTWKVNGKHEFVFGNICILDGSYMLAIVAVEDGKVDVVLLSEGDMPPPADDDDDATLTDLARSLAKNIPADQRRKLAKIHSDLAKSIDDGSITSEKTLFGERLVRIKAALSTGRHDDWDAWFDGTNDLLDAFSEFQELGKDGVASGFAQPFRDIARGLEK